MTTRFCKLEVEKDKEPIVMKAMSGVPQGDPLSSYLFCLAIDPIIDTLKEKNLHPIVYMDDFCIAYDPSTYSA